MADPLLEPFVLKGLTLKNRIFSSAHAPGGFAPDGVPGERYALYLEEKARGGAGLVLFGGSSTVSLDSMTSFGGIDAGRDSVVDFYRDVARRSQEHGAATMVQLTHLGRRGASHAGHWLPMISPSYLRERAHRSYPKAIEDFDIPRVLRDFAAAARRAQDGGLDGIEIAALAGHLIDQFIAPRSNEREDEYGGELTHRVRFLMEVLHAVREAVGSDFVVGVRLPGDEGVPRGLEADEAVAVAKIVSDSGLVDFYSVIYGGGFTDRELADIMPPTGRALGAALPVAGRIRDVVAQPVLHAGRVADLATARHAVREGYVDLVGMTRAHIADPHIVRKIERGEEDRIRPCVGASMCIGEELFCIHNPATGREATIPHLVEPAGERRRVVVVGGGPAGLEAARVSAERGHDVTLLEANSTVGGQVVAMSRTDRQSEKRSITEWLAAEARRAGVHVRTGVYAEADDILALEPDVVIVATGGMPAASLPDGGEDLVLSSSDVLGRAPLQGKSVIVYDDHGGEQALTAVEYLTGHGNDLHLVTPDPLVGRDLVHTVRPDYMRVFYQDDVTLTPDLVLTKVARTPTGLGATFHNEHTGASTELHADAVVVEQATIPITDVYDDLRDRSVNRGETDQAAFIVGGHRRVENNPDGAFELYRIGDASAHRGVHAAIFDARRLTMNL
jgi:2,4-dienoyl-CoA reductase-like NADH-dependent reductase (Old Yellow Enzyme family)/thioredoxin reductase